MQTFPTAAISMFALLAICIVIAPVFSGEYQTGKDAVVLSALTVRAVLYAILTVIMLPSARLGFKKHQVA